MSHLSTLILFEHTARMPEEEWKKWGEIVTHDCRNLLDELEGLAAHVQPSSATMEQLSWFRENPLRELDYPDQYAQIFAQRERDITECGVLPKLRDRAYLCLKELERRASATFL